MTTHPTRPDEARGRFPTPKAAIAWYVEASARFQAPNPMHPRTDCVNRSTGERARIQVDGGKGGDLDGTLADLSTVGEVLADTRRHYPRAVAALVETLTSRVTQQAIADRHRISAQALSAEIGRALDSMRPRLEAAGLLRSQPARPGRG